MRDFVLGSRVITGQGKHLRFGGEVMKNVAGYDLSRLMAGSFGCLGVLTEVSLKVLPKPASAPACVDRSRTCAAQARRMGPAAGTDQRRQPTAAPLPAPGRWRRVGQCRARTHRRRISTLATGTSCASSGLSPTRARCGACRCRTTRQPRLAGRPAGGLGRRPALAEVRADAVTIRGIAIESAARHLLYRRRHEQSVPAAVGAAVALSPPAQGRARSAGDLQPRPHVFRGLTTYANESERSRENCRAPRKPKASCAPACTVASATPPARPTSCWATSWTVRAGAST